MTPSRRWIALVFVAGCVAGGAASRVEIPAVRAGTNPTRWEYACYQFPPVTFMNQLGAQGWELAASTSNVQKGLGPGISTDIGFCFKRALP